MTGMADRIVDTKRWLRKRVAVVGSLLVVTAAIITILWAVFDSGERKPESAVSLVGTWAVVGVHRGDNETDIPASANARFTFHDDGESLEASDGNSAYGCSYAFVAASKRLTLADCVTTPNVSVHPAKLETLLADAFDEAFRSNIGSVRWTGSNTASISLGSVVFDVVRAS